MTLPKSTAQDAPNNLAAAIDLATRGLKVFPQRPNHKGEITPITGWQSLATDDLAIIRDWFRTLDVRRVGLLCGERNNIAVLDVDEGHADGVSGSATLRDRYGIDDPTCLTPVWSRTPRGGFHLYFEHEPDLPNLCGEDGLGPGLDIRAQGLSGSKGALVIAPGSWKDGKQYVEEGAPLGSVPLPKWPSFLLPPKKAVHAPPVIETNPAENQIEWALDYLAYKAAVIAETEEGTRYTRLNGAAFWAGGAAQHGFVTEIEARALLVPAGVACGLSENETDKTFEKGWNDGLKPKNAISEYPPAVHDDIFDDDPTGLTRTPEECAADNALVANGDVEALAKSVADPQGPPPAPVKSATERDPGGDYALSRAYADRVTGRMMYNRADGKWWHYSSEVGAWRPCERGEADVEMVACARSRFDAACTSYRRNPSSGNLKRQNEAASYLKNANLIERALKMARSIPTLVCVPGDFNGDPFSFAVPNGLLDLRTGKLTPPAPGLMVSKLGGPRFDPAATCPQFDSFIAKILPDAAVRDFVRQAIGYTMTGLVDDEKVFLCYGVGRNGKSVLANVIDALLSEFSIAVSPELFTKTGSDNEGARQIASLVDKRLCLANEAAQGSVWRDDRLKLLASREPIQARYLHRESFTFTPTAKVWFRTNHLPGAHDASDGLWRRLVPIPFAIQIPEAEVIADLDRVIIRDELPGVLNWALSGAKEYLAAGRLHVPQVLTAISSQYRASCDVFGQWIEDETITVPGHRLPSGEAYRAFVAYCKEQGAKAPPQIGFSRSMGERGYPPAKGTRGVRYFAGLKLSNGFVPPAISSDEEDLIG